MSKKKKRKSTDVIGQFREFFWAARRAHTKAGKNASPDTAEHKSAMSFAHKNGMDWSGVLLEASLISKQGKNDEALKKLEAMWDKIPTNALCLGWYIRGTILCELNQFDESVKALHKALKDPNFEKTGYAWNCLGVVHYNNGEYDEALKTYRKVLDDPNYDTRGYTWNNIGLVYLRKGEIDKAINSYKKALDDPNFDTPGYAWNNIGNAYSNKGEYDEAIKAYQKALEDPNLDIHALVLTNLGNTYHKAGLQKKARATIKDVLKKEDPEGVQHAKARSLLSLLDSDLKPEAMSASDRALLERPASVREEVGPEQRMLSKVQAAAQSQYENYLQEESTDRDNVLSILRGWSSAVTLLEGSERLWRGGGYFLKWQGKGIVIDPGFDFLRNFHDAGYHAREINAVLVSHNHSDHNADLKSIDDLRYELYKRRKEDPHGGIGRYVLIWDPDSQATVKFSAEDPEHHHSPIIFNVGLLDSTTPTDTISHPRRLPFSVTYFRATHDHDLNSAVGFKLTLEAKKVDVFTLGFTGDTEFFPELPKYLEGCDLLLAHISQPETDEFDDPNTRKKNHLGYRGLVELIKLSKPKLTLVGEFWAGLADLRIDLVQGLRRLAGTEAILPAGIGMHLNLPEMDIECTECGTKTPFANVRVAPPVDSFGDLAYLCPNCILS